MNAEGSMVSDRSKPTISLELPPPKLGTGENPPPGKKPKRFPRNRLKKSWKRKRTNSSNRPPKK